MPKSIAVLMLISTLLVSACGDPATTKAALEGLSATATTAKANYDAASPIAEKTIIAVGMGGQQAAEAAADTLSAVGDVASTGASIVGSGLERVGNFTLSLTAPPPPTEAAQTQ